jgi:hypothetical protein
MIEALWTPQLGVHFPTEILRWCPDFDGSMRTVSAKHPLSKCLAHRVTKTMTIKLVTSAQLEASG